MARTVDYHKKIEELEQKIEKKTEQLKDLKAELKNLEAMAAQQDMQEITDFIAERNIDPSEVVKVLKEHFASNPDEAHA